MEWSAKVDEARDDETLEIVSVLQDPAEVNYLDDVASGWEAPLVGPDACMSRRSETTQHNVDEGYCDLIQQIDAPTVSARLLRNDNNTGVFQ